MKNKLLPSNQNYSELLFILLGVFFINLLFLTASPFQADIQYWLTWTERLQHGGFASVEANYPPIFVEWLWIVSKIYAFLDITIQQSFFFRFLVHTPVLFTHLLLSSYVWFYTEKNFSHQGYTNKAILWLTAFNPAFLADGPVWGQVDLLSFLFIIPAIQLSMSEKNNFLSPLFFALAILTKFQSIAFLPLLGALWLKKPTALYRSILPLVLGVLAILLPYIFNGSFTKMLTLAYTGNTSMYPYSTMNASNLWMLLGGNTLPDNRLIFFWSESTSSFPAKLWTPKILGMLLFSLYSLYIFISTLRAKNILQQELWQKATLLAFAFFFLLPGMHERYLFNAVPVVLLWTLYQPKAQHWAWIITLIVYINISLIQGVKGNVVIESLAYFTAFSFILIHLPKKSLPVIKSPRALFILPLLWIFIFLYQILSLSAVVEPNLSATNQLLNMREPNKSTIGWGSIQYDQAVGKSPLEVAGTRYQYGIGTHAPSRIKYSIPPEAVEFRVWVGVDDEALPGKVQFNIYLDNKLAWQSPVLQGMNPAKECRIPLADEQHLILEVDELGSSAYDHANWMNPVFIYEKE
jgi:Gpi18-like mannosyltransferase